ncbi:MAG: hypothetical protein JWN91_2823 [Nocardioides sp.]|nr:hypothetical protein [Nocardioides sp.]
MLSLTYVSSASEQLDVQRLREMLATIRPKNETLGLTGMLLYSGGNIIQTLEGPDEAVDTTFASIVRDPRHRGVFTLLRERIDERAFPDWTMGFRHPSHEEIGEIDGFTSFLQQPAGRDLGDAAGSAYQLLRLFKENMR